MSEIFANTFYFVALLSPADQAHERARAVTSDRPIILVTSAWVLMELANSLSHRDTRSGFIEMLQALRSDPGAVIVGPDQNWYEAGLNLYISRSDKDWSLTDCISFVVMKERGITDALTGDHHFEQAGFQALLK